jgi:mannose-6-phosphate isomerase
MDANLQIPLFFQPVYKEYVWGGNRFRHDFRRPLPPGVYAESWEISDHPDGPTPILAGPYAGLTLSRTIALRGADILGPRHDTAFPLLVKLIDAAQTLSVQVHPDEKTAARWGGEAKSEMWFVLAATPDAHIYSGFRPGTTEADVRRALAQGTVADLLQRFPAKPGMVFNTPGGRVHAIGAGCLLLEIQQDANTTYRLYDWDRLDRNGTPRPLHVEQALRVIDWSATGSPVSRPAPPVRLPDGRLSTLLLDSPLFHVEGWRIDRPCDILNPSDGFLLFFARSESLRIRPDAQPAILLPRYTSCLVPAAMRHFRIAPESAPSADLVVARLP